MGGWTAGWAVWWVVCGLRWWIANGDILEERTAQSHTFEVENSVRRLDPGADSYPEKFGEFVDVASRVGLATAPGPVAEDDEGFRRVVCWGGTG